jgi:G:T-mismatch repair DNA endonuclease (very short patch repair protein)
MTDVFTKAKRSAVMGRICCAGNMDTELRAGVARVVFAEDVRDGR